MDPLKPRRTRKQGPEAAIQESIMRKLKGFDWAVIATHGNEYQMGFPDLYCMHRMYGTRWVEVKNPVHYSFTEAQMEIFPMFSSKGVGIWILTSDAEYELKKIFGPSNWHSFLGRSSCL